MLDEIVTFILAREGSAFTDDPLDRGGATKFGITQRAWAEHAKRLKISTPVSVEFIDIVLARNFYWIEYVTPLAWIEDHELLDLVADCAVHHGATQATKWMQRASGALADGHIGPETRAKVNGDGFQGEARAAVRQAIYVGVLGMRMDMFADICVRDPSQLRFLRGWLNRLQEFLR